MTLQYAEITFVVERDSPGSTPLPLRLIYACHRPDARHNPILRASFCPIHGFAAELLTIRLTVYARTQWVPG
ncbi:MAG: hypothetical protein ACLPZM_08230 [Thermoplasmata archaeon]